MAKIVFTIDKKGQVTLEVDGVKGEVCKDLTKPFIDAFAGGIVTETEKPEAYEIIDDIEATLFETNGEE